MITVGCDPEFVMINKDGMAVHPVSELRGFSSPCEIGWFGYDGTGESRIFEIRPNYSVDPRVVVENIRQLFGRVLEVIPETRNYRWLAGSSVYSKPLGGHIHFGAKSSSDIVLALDVLLAPLVALIEVESDRRTRLDKNYGHLGAAEPKLYGFEYRTPASWLWAPGLAIAVLALGQGIVQDGLSRRLPWQAIRVLEDRYVRRDDAAITCRVLDLAVARTSLKDIWAAVSRIGAAHRFYPEITYLKTLTEGGRVWSNTEDMKARWRL